MHGFAGITLRINLRTGEISKEPLRESFARDWMGARGFISRVLYDEVPRDALPLGPDNRFIMATGPLTGTYAPSGSKVAFGCISPATNGVADSSMGGHLGPELKYAGYDLVILEDAAPSPTYLYIDDDQVELRSAEPYWGMGSLTLEAKMKSDLGEDFQIATIGPAGENQVAYACITHDFGRQAGRCGTGAVLGSKRIKAIAVRGTKSLGAKDLTGLFEHTSAIIERTKTHPNMAPWQKYGTSFFVEWANERGCFPTRNFETSFSPHAKEISGDRLVEDCDVNHKACFGCWMNCGKYTKASVPGKPEVHVEGPEYETTAMFGGSCALRNIHDVAYANYLCDELGVDTISAGSVIAFAMECFEKGILKESDLEGNPLRFGSIDDVEHMLNLIAARKGIGHVLAGGTRAAAKTLKQGTEKFAIQCKGLEFSGYDTRWYPAQLLSFCTADIGAHHNRAWSITTDIQLGRETMEGKAEAVIYLQHIRPLFDALSCCRLFWGELDVTPEEHVETVRHLTGWDLTLDECLVTSERIWNLNRAHYLERNGGPGKQHDAPPKRPVENHVPTGPAKGKRIEPEDFEKLLLTYYEGRGWDRNGHPTEPLLRELNLKDVCENLKTLGLLGAPPKRGIPAKRGKALKPLAM